MATGYLLQCSNCGTRTSVPADTPSGKNRCSRCGAPLIAANTLPLEVTDATWDEEVLGSPVPTLVEAWRPGCGVCEQYEVSLRHMAANLYGKARILKLDAEANAKVAGRYDIRGVPTLLLFREGEHVATFYGPQGERGLREALGV